MTNSKRNKSDPKPELKIPSTNGIQGYMHCALCLNELPKGELPQQYQRTQVGFTKEGLQVWCVRHDVNVMHIHFEGQKHPANTNRELSGGEVHDGETA